MKPIFTRGPSIQQRLLIVVLCSLALIYADRNVSEFGEARKFLSTLVSPLQYVANIPSQMLDSASQKVESRSVLENKVVDLQQQLFRQQTALLRQEHLQQENIRLRALLDSPTQQDARKMVAEIMTVDSDPFRHQVVIDKGSRHGVYEGQPVINEQGVIGQVTQVSSLTSRVLLITDPNHGIPVRIQRNDIRAFAQGDGASQLLTLPFIPHSKDILVGDLLVTSGLGGRFPEGYPVARISTFDYTEGQPYSEVVAKPVVSLDRIRYMLLIWQDEARLDEKHNPEAILEAKDLSEDETKDS